MTINVCPCTSLENGAKLVAVGDFFCSIVLVITILFGSVGLLFSSNDQLQLRVGQRIAGCFGLVILGVTAAVQVWAARVLYDYTKPSTQRTARIWKWFLVTGIIITLFVLVFIQSLREWRGTVALFSLATISFKFYCTMVVTTFIKSLGAPERNMAYTPTV